MKVTVEYTAQAKRAVGRGSEQLDLPAASSVQDVVRLAAEKHGAELRQILFHSDDSLHPSVLLFLRDEQVRWHTPTPLQEGDVVTILSPISGG